MRSPRLPLALALALSILPGAALAKLGSAKSAAVAFHASGPGGMAIEGKTSDLRVTEGEGGVVTVTVPLANLDTGIGLRNKHMREKYLEVEKFPNAELEVPRASLAFPPPGQTVTKSAAGTITIHGVKKPVQFNYRATNDGGAYRVHGAVDINMKDFGINVPSYLGVTVKPEVQVTTDFVTNDG